MSAFLLLRRVGRVIAGGIRAAGEARNDAHRGDGWLLLT
jgi:hypothetical protein